MGATLSNLDTRKINLGPCKITFNGDELGRTQGDSVFRFTTEYQTERTEEDGDIMDIVVNHKGEVTIPIIYTDPVSVAATVPWAELVADGEKRALKIGSAIGQVMNEYAAELVIHPLAKDDTDKSADITLQSAYPLPQTLELAHSQTSKRINNTMFKAQKDADGNYFIIGDPNIGATATISTAQTVVKGDTDVALMISLIGDTFLAAAGNKANWTLTAGTTGIAIASAYKISDRLAIVTLSHATGAVAGTAKLKAKATALTGAVDSNELSFVVENGT